MGVRGRTSSAELSVISGSGITAISRPEPLQELTDEQASEWNEIVNRLPAEWFPRETWPMLAAYCRHAVAARRIGQLIADLEGSENFDIKDYDRLLAMQEREGRAISSLATRMRLSQHSSYDKAKTRGIVASRKPWEPKT